MFLERADRLSWRGHRFEHAAGAAHLFGVAGLEETLGGAKHCQAGLACASTRAVNMLRRRGSDAVARRKTPGSLGTGDQGPDVLE